MSVAFRAPNEQELVRVKRWQLSVFFVCLVGYIGYYLVRQNLSAAFPLLSNEFGYNNNELGQIAFYSELAYALGKFINGPLADKLGGKKLFLLGMIGAVICNGIFTFGSTLIYFILIWCLCRYFLSMGWGGLTKMIGHWYPPERNGVVMGLISINFQFGGVLATLFAGFLVAQGHDWKGLFIFPALVVFFIFIWSVFASKETPRDLIPDTNFGHGEHNIKAQISQQFSDDQLEGKPLLIIKQLLKLSSFRHVLIFSFITTFLRSIFLFWIPKLLVDIGMGTSTAIFNSALFPFLGCIGTILLGWYTDKYAVGGDRARAMWIMLLGLVLSLFGICLLIGNPIHNGSIVILLGLAGFFLLGPYSMSSGCLTLDIAGPKAAGSATGLIDGIGYIGGAISVWMAGKFSDVLGWKQVFIFLTFFACLATLSAYMMSRGYQRRARAV